jgi:hypothetical protein
MLSGASAILIAGADLALVRALRVSTLVNRALDERALAGPPASLPAADVYIPSGPPAFLPLPTTVTPNRPVLTPDPVNAFAPPANPASDPLPAPDPGAIPFADRRTPRITSSSPQTLAPQPAETHEKSPPLKVVLYRTDTHHRGGIIDTFC